MGFYDSIVGPIRGACGSVVDFFHPQPLSTLKADLQLFFKFTIYRFAQLESGTAASLWNGVLSLTRNGPQ